MENYNKGSFHNKDKKTIIRCPSNHSLGNVNAFDDIEHRREKENSPRHYHPQKYRINEEEHSASSRSFRYH